MRKILRNKRVVLQNIRKSEKIQDVSDKVKNNPKIIESLAISMINRSKRTTRDKRKVLQNLRCKGVTKFKYNSLK